MITKYNAEYENDNILLIVNLDFNYEISDFDFKDFSKNLKKEIINLVRKTNAKKVKIIMNGILISTLLLSPVSLENDYSEDNIFITNNTIKDNFNMISFDSEDISKNTSLEEIEIKNDDKINENTTPNKVSTSTDTKKDTLSITNSTIPISPVVSNTTPKDTIENQVTEEIFDNNIYVTVHRNNGNVIKLELEEYLIGVVASEMPASFNIEALKAQAVVARTYALKRINENKILTDTTSTQVYKDNAELKNLWKNDFNKYYEKVKNAVMSTEGIVLMFNNTYIDAVYHSTSNGMTEDAFYVWGYSVPYLKSVESKSDINVSSYKREIKLTLENLSLILNTNITTDTTFVLKRNSSGRVTSVKVNNIEINGTTFRALLGLRSTDFTIELTEENAIITTYGYGHGVGMSQYGANSMANNGYSFKDILNHYYQNIKIINI